MMYLFKKFVFIKFSINFLHQNVEAYALKNKFITNKNYSFIIFMSVKNYFPLNLEI